MVVANPFITQMNSYKGGVMQQATSLVTSTNQLCYDLVNNCYSKYGFEVRFPFFLKFHLGRTDDWHSTNQVMIMGCVYSNT